MSAFLSASQAARATTSPFMRATALPNENFGRNPTKNSSWASQHEELRGLWAAGAALNDMSDALGRTPSAILTQAARLGLPRRSNAGRKNFNGENKPRNVLNFSSKRIARVRDYYDSEPKATQARCCLMCKSSFPSTSVGHRICDGCKSTQRYQRTTGGFDDSLYLDVA